jgi:hypothetical protein
MPDASSDLISEALAVVVHVQRLDADAVPGQVEHILARIEDGDREHAVELAQEADALRLVQAQQHLRVGMRTARHAAPRQIGCQLDMIEDLAVLHHGDAAIVGDEGLMSARKVDD